MLHNVRSIQWEAIPALKSNNMKGTSEKKFKQQSATCNQTNTIYKKII
jgi:hypothetical protein